jgi:3-phosphoglycerate kinase
VEDIVGDMKIFDLGKVSMSRYLDVIKESKMIVWNGPVGVYEYKSFSTATKRLAEAISQATKRGAITLVGGGDTVDFHLKYKVPLSAYTFVSMGGGAMLEFVAGKKFGSLKVLEK